MWYCGLLCEGLVCWLALVVTLLKSNCTMSSSRPQNHQVCRSLPSLLCICVLWSQQHTHTAIFQRTSGNLPEWHILQTILDAKPIVSKYWAAGQIREIKVTTLLPRHALLIYVERAPITPHGMYFPSTPLSSPLSLLFLLLLSDKDMMGWCLNRITEREGQGRNWLAKVRL